MLPSSEVQRSQRKNDPSVENTSQEKHLTCIRKAGRMKEQGVSVLLGTVIALSWQTVLGGPGGTWHMGCSARGSPSLLPHQIMCFKQCVETSGCGTSPLGSLSCWRLRISWLKTTNIPVSLTEKYLWGPYFCLVERIIDIDVFPQGIMLSFSECFLTQFSYNRKLSTGYIVCQSYAQPFIYCSIMLLPECYCHECLI